MCGFLLSPCAHGALAAIKGDLTLAQLAEQRMRFGIGMNTDHTLEEVGNSSR
jgi:DNA-directed RNA polymerase sigma subunit (sigma70/sigma32)